jgi:arachidonate 15-lipoxygenase
MFLFRHRPASVPSDANRATRQKDLEALRESYDYAQSPAMENLTVNKQPLPRAELPGLSWILNYVGIFARLKISLAGGPARVRALLATTATTTTADGTAPPSATPSFASSDLAYELLKILPAAKTAVLQGSEAAVQQVQEYQGSQLYDIIDSNIHFVEEEQGHGHPDRPLLQDADDRDAQCAAAERDEVYLATRDYRVMLDMDSLEAHEREYVDSFTSDTAFARARVAGLNPMSLRAVTAADMNQGIGGWMPTDDHLQDAAATFAKDTLLAAREQNRLYMLEFKWLEAAPDSAQRDRFVFIPKALFAVPNDISVRKRKPLIPVAIWIYRKGSDQSTAKLYTPKDGYSWEIAKLIITALDGNDHEYYQHLTLTHLLLEPFGIAVKRQLHRDHPLARLLEPHFLGTIFINRQAVQVLLAENGGVDKNMMSPISQMAPVLNEKLAQIPFNNHFLETNLRARGVTDTKLDFPYRDYARPLWGAIAMWVKEYVSEYYQDDEAVIADTELQAWAKEIVTHSRTSITAFGDESYLHGQSEFVISSRVYLSDALTMIIFTASCQHSALNFAQKPFLAYAPAWPLSMKRSELPPSGSDAQTTSCADWKAWLPSHKEAQVQWSINQVLGGVHYTKLGEYPANVTSGNPSLKASLQKFQDSLIEIGKMIDLREESSPIKYRVLHPDDIPASINI